MIRGSGALWFVVKFVDGDNFWEEGDPAGWGVQRHDGRPTFDGTDDGVGRDRVAPQPSLWCDLSGPTGGLCVLDHPDNPSHPVPFYASCRAPGYGEVGRTPCTRPSCGTDPFSWPQLPS
jgi:hypothetical protein